MNRDISFEEAMEQLEDILEQLSANGLALDESVKQYAKAADLIELCQQKLEEARVRVEETSARIGRVKDNNEF